MKSINTPKTNTIGKTIKNLRLKNGWSQGDAAVRLSISIPAFSKIETGITIVNLKRLSQIASIFDVTLAQIISLESEPITKKTLDEIEELKEKIILKEEEISKLQKTAIKLYEILGRS